MHRGHVKRLRHDADHGIGKAIQPNGFPYNAGIAAKLHAPQLVHQYRDMVITRLRFDPCKGPPQLRLYPEHRKDPRRGRQHTHLGRSAIGSEWSRALLHHGHRIEAAIVLLPEGKVIRAHGQGGIDIAPFRSYFFDGHKPVRLRKRQRAQHHVIDQRENRSRCADAERERHRYNKR